MKKTAILIVDDDPSIRRILEFKLTRKGYVVQTANDGAEAFDKIQQSTVDVLLTDVRMPNLTGTELLSKAQQHDPHLAVILITAHATVQQAVDAMKSGAIDYITKPFEDEQLFEAIERAARYRELSSQQPASSRRKQSDGKNLIGQSESFTKLIESIDKIAVTNATVLLSGESGTGKELVARTIHDRSSRSQAGFVAVNCAAIPKELIESELFGYKKGAFTGANKDKKGKFQLADGGTLLLDEVGDLAPALQATLLRVLQEGVVDPIGGEGNIPVDVRLIAATHVDLQQKVDEGAFREDLYYRLNVIPVHIPPLRERSADIPLLINHFIAKYTSEQIKVTKEVLDTLMQYHWPGNIRELENLIERMLVLRTQNVLTHVDVPSQILHPQAGHGKSHSDHSDPTLDEAQTSAIIAALEATNWNQSKAADRLNIPRHVLIYRMKKLDIKKPGRR